jgi:dCTP deaminase
MTVLVNDLIELRMKQGAIVIEPFNKAQLNNGSYDVTLGRYVARLRNQFKPSAQGCGVLHLNDIKGIDAFILDDLEDHDDILYLAEGERVLAHTHEFIGGRHIPHPLPDRQLSVLPEMRACSTTGRWGITVALCAGWGDVGYVNRWTMEMVNINPGPVAIKRDSVVAQIIFHDVASPTRETSYEKIGSYQKSGDVEELKRSWTPMSMLPRPMKKAPFHDAVAAADKWTKADRDKSLR